MYNDVNEGIDIFDQSRNMQIDIFAVPQEVDIFRNNQEIDIFNNDQEIDIFGDNSGTPVSGTNQEIDIFEDSSNSIEELFEQLVNKLEEEDLDNLSEVVDNLYSIYVDGL